MLLFGHLRPIQDEDLQVYEDAAENAANILSESWMCWANGKQHHHLLMYHILQPHPYLEAKRTSYQSNIKN